MIGVHAIHSEREERNLQALREPSSEHALAERVAADDAERADRSFIKGERPADPLAELLVVDVAE